jgi:hypothetical protein
MEARYLMFNSPLGAALIILGLTGGVGLLTWLSGRGMMH